MVSVRVRLLVGIVLATAAVACVEGPFAHSNPNDPDYPGTLSIVASRDTVSPEDSIVTLQVVGDPPITGYRAQWVSGNDTLLVHRGDGVFQIGSVPVTVQAVEVQALFVYGTSVSRIVYVKPSP